MTNTSTDAQDLQDMEALTHGQDASLDNLMERHAPRLLRYLVRLLGSQHEAEDIAQDTFVKVYQKCSSFDPQYRFSSWLTRIATNLALDRLRQRQRRPEIPLQPNSDSDTPQSHNPTNTAPDPLQSLVARETGELVRQAVQSLPADLRIPLLLTEYEGLTHDEAGTVLGCTAKAVEMRLYRARQALRGRLQSHSLAS